MKKRNSSYILIFILTFLIAGCSNGRNIDTQVSTKDEDIVETIIPEISTSDGESNHVNHELGNEITQMPEDDSTPIVFDDSWRDESAEGDYTKEFMEQLELMDKKYIFKDYKGIDLTGLAKKYYPLFLEADQNKDMSAAYVAWMLFTYEIPDGHVYVFFDQEVEDEVKKAISDKINKLYGLDYGFSLITKEDGDTVFINVNSESEAYQLGVRDGYRILSIDGEEIEKARQKATILDSFADNFNREFVRSLFVTCNCQETIHLTFEDKDGVIVNQAITGKGNYRERYWNTVELLYHNCQEKENLTYDIISKDTAILYLNSMMIVSDNEFNDEGTYFQLKDTLRKTLSEIKSKGVTKLIIDLRGNGGGYGDVSKEIASLFSDNNLYCYTVSFLGHEKDERITECTRYTSSENAWGDGEILLLVNAYTASATELFIHTMKQLPNVRTMGFTNSCGATGGVLVYKLKDFNLSYPSCVNLDKEHNIIAEADASGNMTMPVDIKVPLDDEAIQALFDDGTDYVLNYAMDVLDEKLK